MITSRLPTTVSARRPLLLGFMVNASYARWREARIRRGSIANHSRNLARRATTLLGLTVPGARPEIGVLEMIDCDEPKAVAPVEKVLW